MRALVVFLVLGLVCVIIAHENKHIAGVPEMFRIMAGAFALAGIIIGSIGH